jgi:transcriptional regulator with XRE-family HTH domain
VADEDTPAPPPELTEQRFAANLRQAREENGVSQVRLAQEMAKRGWPWRQQTVTRVESGQRMVRLGEATAIADILGTSVARLTVPARDTRALNLLGFTAGRAREAYGQITEWTHLLLFAQRQLRTSLAEAERAGYFDSALVRDAVAEATDVLKVTPEQAVAEGRVENEDLLASAAEHDYWTGMVKDVVRYYTEEGQSVRSISRMLPVSESTIRKILHEHEVEIRETARGAPGEPEQTPLAELTAEAKRRYDAGETLEAIGQWIAEKLPPDMFQSLAGMAEVTAESLKAAGLLPAAETAQGREGAVGHRRDGG